MATSIQITQTDDLCHIGKSMPAIKPCILSSATGTMRRGHSPDAELRPNLLHNGGLGLDISTEENSRLEDLQTRISMSKVPVNRHDWCPQHTCFGVSLECLAMASACSHDHDYTMSVPKECSSASKILGTVRRKPAFPSATAQKPKNGPRSSFIRKSGVAGQIYAGPIIVGKSISGDTKHLNPMLQYRTKGKRPAPPERPNMGENEIKEDYCDANRKVTGIAVLESNKGANHEPQTKTQICSEDFHQMNDLSPRPSIAPFPPTKPREKRKALLTYNKRSLFSEAKTAKSAAETKEEPMGTVTDSCRSSVDSAYNSLSRSSLSKSRTPSGSRPPSGGKRSATSGLTSSSSSGASSDEWSDMEAPSSSKIFNATSPTAENEMRQIPELADSTNNELNISISQRGRRPRNALSGKKVRKQVAVRNVSAERNRSSIAKFQLTPTPPARKSKKGKLLRSVPMKLRALPKSFWEEPNKTNASHYTILPPVQPLFHQNENEDIADIKPVTPPNEKEGADLRLPITSRDRHCPSTVIRTGDTDLLLRLFDAVESNGNQAGIRAKRGRPKRRPICASSSPRRAPDDNPCVMNSITEKLFPNLSLGNRYPGGEMTASSENDNSHCDGKPYLENKMATSKEAIANGYSTEKSSSASCHSPAVAETAKNILFVSRSPNLQTQPSSILPHLVGQKEYSHLLNELAGCL